MRTCAHVLGIVPRLVELLSATDDDGSAAPQLQFEAVRTPGRRAWIACVCGVGEYHFQGARCALFRPGEGSTNG